MLRSQVINLPVEPYQRISSRTVGSVYLAIESLELFKSVTVRVTYMDTTNTYVDSEMITLSGPDYSGWGNDDTYLYSYISTKKGFTIMRPSTLPVTYAAEPSVVVVETPVVETPVVETPVVETPVVETPVDKSIETPI